MSLAENQWILTTSPDAADEQWRSTAPALEMLLTTCHQLASLGRVATAALEASDYRDEALGQRYTEEAAARLYTTLSAWTLFGARGPVTRETATRAYGEICFALHQCRSERAGTFMADVVQGLTSPLTDDLHALRRILGVRDGQAALPTSAPSGPRDGERAMLTRWESADADA